MTTDATTCTATLRMRDTDAPQTEATINRRNSSLVSLYMRRKRDDEDLVQVPTKEDVDRMLGVWAAFSGMDPSKASMGFSENYRMDMWVAEHRMRAERLATARLTSATWVLVWVTGVLAFATVVLVVVTFSGH